MFFSDDVRIANEGEEWSDEEEPSDHEQEHEFYESLVRNVLWVVLLYAYFSLSHSQAPSVPRHYVRSHSRLQSRQ